MRAIFHCHSSRNDLTTKNRYHQPQREPRKTTIRKRRPAHLPQKSRALPSGRRTDSYSTDQIRLESEDIKFLTIIQYGTITYSFLQFENHTWYMQRVIIKICNWAKRSLFVKKSTIFVLSSWNLVKIINSWGSHIDPRSYEGVSTRFLFWFFCDWIYRQTKWIFGQIHYNTIFSR